MTHKPADDQIEEMLKSLGIDVAEADRRMHQIFLPRRDSFVREYRARVNPTPTVEELAEAFEKAFREELVAASNRILGQLRRKALLKKFLLPWRLLSSRKK